MGKREVTRRAVFLDRDGVLNRPVVREGKPFPPAGLKEFELFEDAAAGCEQLKAAQFFLVVITNQPDVGRGTQERATVEAIHRELQRQIPALDRIEVCFHGGAAHGQPCDCRKPRPGMVERAAAECGIDLHESFVIGDRWRDIDCARAAGCRAVFIDRDYAEKLGSAPDFTVRSFAEAVEVVLRESAAPLYSLPRPRFRHEL